LGFTGCFFIVDDNFIGNKIKVKEVLRELIVWQQKHNFPFEFLTEASLNLADDLELLGLMRDANFKSVFLGIETPSIESLKECGKFQNTKKDLVESFKTIQRNGIKVMGGFIVGFDSDTEEIFDAQIEFIQRTGITTAMVGMLGALPNPRVWERLEKEGRLVKAMTGDNTDGTLNFIPKMGAEKLLAGYARVLRTIYSPEYYYKRIYQLMENYVPKHNKREFVTKAQWASFFKSIFLIGMNSPNRKLYWKLFTEIITTKPHEIALAIEQAGYGEHFMKVTEKVLKSLKSIKVDQNTPSLIKVESNNKTSILMEEIF